MAEGKAELRKECCEVIIDERRDSVRQEVERERG
jgi:hypothetical protein